MGWETDGRTDGQTSAPGAVRGFVVVPEHAQHRPPSDGDLLNERHQVVRDPLRILADPPRRMRAHGVEVPQKNHLPLRRRGLHVRQDVFHEELGSPVRIQRRRGELFRARHRRGLAVHGRGGREDYLAAPVPLHDVHERHRADDVVAVIPHRLRHGLAHGF
eukprot:29739-Pelagococcus_subviridis.AAC.15